MDSHQVKHTLLPSGNGTSKLATCEKIHWRKSNGDYVGMREQMLEDKPCVECTRYEQEAQGSLVCVTASTNTRHTLQK